METTVKQRLTKFINYKGISIRQFCLSIGASPAFVANIVKSIQPDKVNSITNQYPDLNTGWLLTGEGEMLKGNPSTEADILSLAGKNEFLIAYLREKDKRIEELLQENIRLKIELERLKNSSTASSDTNSKHVG